MTQQVTPDHQLDPTFHQRCAVERIETLFARLLPRGRDLGEIADLCSDAAAAVAVHRTLARLSGQLEWLAGISKAFPALGVAEGGLRGLEEAILHAADLGQLCGSETSLADRLAGLSADLALIALGAALAAETCPWEPVDSPHLANTLRSVSKSRGLGR